MSNNYTIGENNYISPDVVINDNVTIGKNNKIYGNVVIYSNVIIGDNNIIYPHNYVGGTPKENDQTNYKSPNLIIHENCIIGNNNHIYDNVILFPKTQIGNDNYIHPNNFIGLLPIDSSSDNFYYDYTLSKGVIIGNKNLFQVDNYILSGVINKTSIGNNNKFLTKVSIGHDVIIRNNIIFYPQTIIGGYSILLDNCNIGMKATINQNVVIGQYSMIGSNNTITRNSFPYYININNNLYRLNEKILPEEMHKYDDVLKEIYNNFNNKNYNLDNCDLPEEIKNVLFEYMENIKLIS
jgi:acyl-[acyl carrier protein]--UDP-N-acetylglucosamine O-acyltransferase